MREGPSNLYVIFFVLAGAVGAFTLIQAVSFPFRFRITSKDSAAAGTYRVETTQLEPLAAYQQEFSTHALFSKPKAAEPVRRVDLAERLKPYTLIGIVQGVEPEALIHNFETNQTHFVQAGEQFDQFKLVEIKTHSVVLEQEGEEQEIHMEGGVA